MTIWSIYVALIAAALVAVLGFSLNAAVVAAIVVVAIVLAHLLLEERTCLDCGSQWRGGAGRPG
jgi:membrane protein implicated in regulation of membrane protease activity